jgi:hypothetical protein
LAHFLLNEIANGWYTHEKKPQENTGIFFVYQNKENGINGVFECLEII